MRRSNALGSAGILPAVSGILPETSKNIRRSLQLLKSVMLRMLGFEVFGRMPKTAGGTPTLPMKNTTITSINPLNE